jgi:uncharacterized membrane protein YkvA (DUF1232 family)
MQQMKQRITVGRRRRRRSGRTVARKLIRQLPSLFKLVFRLLREPRVPRFDKMLFGAVAVYMLTPIDLLPDFFGVLGWVDDLYLLGLALNRLIGSAGADTLLEHWDGDPESLGYLVDGVEEIGGMLPGDVRTGLNRIAKKPRRLRRRGRPRPVRRIRVDDEAQVHVEE